MAEPSDKETQPIKVTDKRQFSSDGSRRPDTDPPSGEPQRAGGEPEPEPERVSHEAGGQSEQRSTRPRIDFASFVTSLSTAALLYLGEFENPETGKREVNLPYAQQHVDIINMLRQKTQGNLTPEEQSLIDTLLAELQLKYVKACGG